MTIYNASSTQYTLGIMLTIALIGMPFVLIYTACDLPRLPRQNHRPSGRLLIPLCFSPGGGDR